MKKTTQKKSLKLLACLVLSMVGAFPFLVNAQTTQTFSLTSTWTAPSCVTSVRAEVWGAGGGGAGNSTGADGGGGGAGGGYSRAINVAVTPGVTYTVTVGVGGAFGLMAADATADGGDGTESWFKNTGTVYANGGGGGSRPVSGNGGNGGAAGLSGTGGDATFIGGNGGSGRNDATGFGGGGGSSAGTGLLANGTNGTNNGGTGGVAPAGGGDGGDGTTADGLPGVWPGGGGGGAGSNGKGGAGADGKVFLDWTNGIETQPTMTSANSKTVCSGVNVALGLTASSGLGSNFTWVAANNPNTTGESLTEQTDGTINDVITNITSVDQTVTYTVTPSTAGGCVGVPQVVSVTITPDAFILLSSAVGTDSQTVCVNYPITTITYTIVGGTTATVSLLPAGVSGSYDSNTNTFTITGTPTVTGTFDFRVTTNGNCTNPYIDGQIVVVNSTSVVLSSLLGSDNQTVCINTPINDITYSVGAGNTASASGLPAGVTGSFAGSTLTISGTPTVVGVYDYTVTTTGSCPPQTTDGTITVTPDGVVTLASAIGTDSQVVCENTPITDITYTVSGGATGMVITALPIGFGTTLGAGSMTISGQTAATGTFGYTVTTTGTCEPDTITGTITVNPTTAIVLTSILGSDNQTVCENDPITDITYNVGSGATVSTLPAGVTGTYAAGVFTISGTPTVPGNYSYTVTTTGPCVPPATADGTITVNPDGVLTLASAPGTDNQIVCENIPITDITYTVSGGATGMVITALPIGFGTTLGAGSMTISGQTAATGTFGYTVTTTGTCEPDTLTGTITVNPTTAIVLTSILGSDNQTVCENDPITDITYNVGSGATVSTLPAGVTGTYAAGVFTISGTPTVPGNYSYTVTTTGPCVPPATAEGTITVNPDGVLTLASAPGTDNQIVCENIPITDITYTVSGGATGMVITALPLGFGTTLGPGFMTISGQTAATGTFDYTVTTTGTCEPDTLTGTITVNPTTAIVLTSILGSDNQTVCENDPITDITYNVGSGATVSSLPAGLTGSYAAGVFTISGSPSVVGNYTYTVTTTGPCTPPATANGTITVNPDGTIALASAVGTDTQTVCESTPITPITYTVSGGATGMVITALPLGFGTTLGAGSMTISGQTAASGTYGYTVTTTGTCQPDTLTGSISIIPTSAILLTSGPGTDNQTVCANDFIIDITYNTGGNATVSPLPAGLTGSYAAGVFTISGKPTVPGNYTYTVTTNTACPPVSANGSITVNPEGVLALSSAVGTDSQIVCESTPITPITYTVSGGNNGAVITALPLGLNTVFSGNTLTISGQTAATGTYGYTVTSTGVCRADTLTGTITIDPTSGIVLTSLQGTQNQVVCENIAIQDITYNVGSGGTVSTLPAGITSSVAAGVLTISGTPTLAGNYTYTVTTNGACPATTANGSITVNPNAKITLISGAGTDAQTACINDSIIPIRYKISGGGTGATVTFLPAGFTNTLSFDTVLTISGLTGVTGTFGYTVVTTGSCLQDTAIGSITISSSTTIALTSAAGTDAQTVCENTPITDITYSISGAGSATVSTLPTGVTGSYSAGVFSITGTPTTAGSYTYTISTTGGCSAQTASGTITVNENAVLTLSSAPGTDAQTLCENNPITAITYSVSGGGTGASASGLPAGISASFAGSTLTISGSTAVAGTHTYTVVSTGTCIQDTLTGTININSGTGITLTSGLGSDAQSICEGSAIITITYSVSGVGANPTITTLPTGVTGSFAGGVYTITGTPAVGDYSYTLSSTGTCPVQSAVGTFTVNPNSSIALTSAVGTDQQNVCINVALTDITYTVSGGATGATVTTLPDGVTGSYAAGVFTISGTPSVAGSTNYTVTTTGNCTQQSLTGIIDVNTSATITLTSAVGTDGQTVCALDSIVDITYTLGGGAIGATVTTLPAGISGAYVPRDYTISGMPTGAGVTTYTVTTTGSCPEATATGTVTVNQNALIALSSAVGTDDQSVCVNTAITAITYTISGAGTGATVTALPGGVTGAYAAGEFTISGTPSVAGTFDYTVTPTGSCVNQTQIGRITVEEDGAIALTTAVGTDDQSVCVNISLANITYAVTGGATSATVTGLPAGVAGSYAAGVFTITGTPAVEGIFNYTVTTTGSCAQATALGSMTITPNATIGLSSATNTDNQSVCLNTAITDITYTVSNSSGVTVSTLPAGLTSNFAAGVFTITGTPSVVGNYTYTVTAAGNCTQAFATGTIIVNEDAAIALSSAVGTDDQTVCEGATIVDITYTVTGGATNASATGLPDVLGGAYAAGVFTISGAPTVSGTFNYTVNTTGNCVQTATTGTITVNPSALMALTSAISSDAQTICLGTSITAITYTVSGGATGATVSTLPAGVTSNFAGDVFTISGTPSAVGMTNYTVTTTGPCNPATATGSITVIQTTVTLTSAALTNAQTICAGTAVTAITYTVSAGATGATVSGLPAGVTSNFAAGVLTISGTATSVGANTYTVTTTGPCTPATATGSITRRETTISLTSAAATAAQTVCATGTITNIVYAIGGTATGATVTPALPSGVTGTGGATYTIAGTLTGLSAGVHTYTVTTTGGTCAAKRLTFSITVIDPVAGFTADTLRGEAPLLVNFTNTSQNANIYTWDFGDGQESGVSDPSNAYNKPGTYTVVLTASQNSLCPDTASAIVIINENYTIVTANVFTPNGDNMNDFFIVHTTEAKRVEIEIYNRWGKKVFENTDKDGEWNGLNMSTGIPCEDGTYFYILKTTDAHDVETVKTGFITLIR